MQVEDGRKDRWMDRWVNSVPRSRRGNISSSRQSRRSIQTCRGSRGSGGSGVGGSRRVLTGVRAVVNSGPLSGHMLDIAGCERENRGLEREGSLAITEKAPSVSFREFRKGGVGVVVGPGRVGGRQRIKSIRDNNKNINQTEAIMRQREIDDEDKNEK